jgi:methyl-accepting chemotaxis protein
MGMFSKVFGKKANSGNMAQGVSQVRPDEALDLEVGDDGAVIGPDGVIEARTPPKSKQELLAEIQRNYQEVLELVRKVDTHLDESGDRSLRLIELADRVPEGMSTILELKSQTEVVPHAIERVTEIVSSSEGHASAAVEELRGIAARFDEASQRGEALAGAVGEFREILTAVAGSGARLNDVMEKIQTEASSREERLVSLIEREQRWMVFALSLCGFSVAVAIVVAVLFAFR